MSLLLISLYFFLARLSLLYEPTSVLTNYVGVLVCDLKVHLSIHLLQL